MPHTPYTSWQVATYSACIRWCWGPRGSWRSWLLTIIIAIALLSAHSWLGFRRHVCRHGRILGGEASLIVFGPYILTTRRAHISSTLPTVTICIAGLAKIIALRFVGCRRRRWIQLAPSATIRDHYNLISCNIHYTRNRSWYCKYTCCPPTPFRRS